MVSNNSAYHPKFPKFHIFILIIQVTIAMVPYEQIFSVLRGILVQKDYPEEIMCHIRLMINNILY